MNAEKVNPIVFLAARLAPGEEALSRSRRKPLDEQERDNQAATSQLRFMGKMAVKRLV